MFLWRWDAWYWGMGKERGAVTYWRLISGKGVGARRKELVGVLFYEYTSCYHILDGHLRNRDPRADDIKS